MELSQEAKNQILMLDPGATFSGSVVYTKLDYVVLCDIFESCGESKEEQRDRLIDKILN
jgi:hypothetical protein